MDVNLIINDNSFLTHTIPVILETTPLTKIGCNHEKGTSLMECMILEQYKNSPNLKEYLGAFIKELDILFCESELVYQGRLLKNAEGHQLDVIGKILGQDRAIVIHKEFFGFVNAPAAQSFGTFTASVGGLWKSLQDLGFSSPPLTDSAYSKLLMARAYAIGLSNRETMQTFSLNQRTTRTEDLFTLFNMAVYGNPDYKTSGLIQGYSEGQNMVISLQANLLTVVDLTLLIEAVKWIKPLTHNLEFNLV